MLHLLRGLLDIYHVPGTICAPRLNSEQDSKELPVTLVPTYTLGPPGEALKKRKNNNRSIHWQMDK